MVMYKKMSDTRGTIAIKIGGRFFTDSRLFEIFAEELHRLDGKYQFLIIHGGGNEVTALSKKLGLEPLFKDGIRITTEEEMDVVEAVLSGGVNKRIVRLFRSKGIDAVGLSGADGSIFIGESIGVIEGIQTRTGRIIKINLRLLEMLFDGCYMPVVSSTSVDLDGKALNINADTVAFHLAEALAVEKLIFISDVPGIMKGNRVIEKLTPYDARGEIDKGIINGGMIPKVEASIHALEGGVLGIVIGNYEKNGDLEQMVNGKRGTIIEKEIERG